VLARPVTRQRPTLQNAQLPVTRRLAA
jgi:hypothetical protein